MMKLFSQVFVIARIEAEFYARYPKLFLATIIVAVIPALYSVIYLSSMWDPAAHTPHLGVGLVNLDEGIEYRQHAVNAGREVIAKLKAKHTFGYQESFDEEAIRAMVRKGNLAFALIIPRDFSSNAIPGADAGAGKLVIYTSEGNSYQSAALARHFAEDLGHEVNKSLNEQRWALVLSSAVGAQRDVDRLRDGVAQLRKGALELSAGASQTAAGADTVSSGMGRLHDGVLQLTGGVKELGAALRKMDAARPANAELNRLKNGSESLVAGHGDLGRGLVELQSGTQRIQAGVVSFRDEAKDSLLISERIVEGADQLADGIARLDTGLKTATQAQQRLTEGAKGLSAGVGALTGGVSTLGTGIHTMVMKLPDEDRLEELISGGAQLKTGASALSEGTKKVRDGAKQLGAGIDFMAASLPAMVQKMDGSAKGLANSVLPSVEVAAPVQNNGASFAPNIIPGALWLGAGIAAFLIHVRVLPRQAQNFSRVAQMLGKIFIPALVVLLQAMLVVLSVEFLMKIHVVDPLGFVITLAVASITFLVIVFALTRAFGDAGKGLAMVFLAIQISSSGGILPVELSGGVFADISPWLPLTWVVRAIKASMFGAFDGAWQHPLLLVGLGGVAAAAMACTVGHWRYVRQSSMRPAVDF